MDNNQLQNNTDASRIFNDTGSELKTRFDLLPEELKQAILSSDFQMKLFEIAKAHKLTYDKLGQLELETTMVLLGMTPPDEYREDVGENLSISGNVLDGVVHDVNEQIFKPIRESLMKLYKKEEVESGEKINEKFTLSKKTGIQEEKKEATETKPIESKPQESTPSPKIVLPSTPADKVAELKKMVSQAASPDKSQAEKTSEPLSTTRMSISEIIKKAGDMKPQLSEGTPKSTPVELNSEKEVMVSKMEAGKPYGMHTMPNTIGNIAQKEPVKESGRTEDGIFGQIKSIFAEPKKPMDVIVKKDGDLKQEEIQQGTQNNPSGDRYREPI